MGMERCTMVDAADIERVTESLLVHKVQRRVREKSPSTLWSDDAVSEVIGIWGWT